MLREISGGITLRGSVRWKSERNFGDNLSASFRFERSSAPATEPVGRHIKLAASQRSEDFFSHYSSSPAPSITIAMYNRKRYETDAHESKLDPDEMKRC